MSRADELLASLTSESSTSGNIVIDSNRFISIPESLKRIAVQYDHNIETVTFDCPRYADGHDLSKMQISINYIRADDYKGSHLCENVVVDESDPNLIHFDWTISGHVTYSAGYISFIVCAKEVDSEGNESLHWNSEINADMYVSPGIKHLDVILAKYPDIIAQLLKRMSEVDEVVVDAESAVQTIDNFMGGVEVEVRSLDPESEPTVTKIDTETSIKLILGIPKGANGERGKAFSYSDFTEEQLDALTGATGNGIVSISRTDGDGAPGSIDTYTIVYTNGNTSSFTVRNGANGEGAGDMMESMYDPKGKHQDIFEYVDRAVASCLTEYTETDPTVPEWAKAAAKPTYTASEVGALSSDTTIPSKVSDLENDAGYMTEFIESDPTVPSWAKSETKPNYTAAEVGADAAGSAKQALDDAKLYTDQQIAIIPTPDVSGQINTHNTSTDTHNDIRLLITGLADRLNALANSDDITLDQMAEVVAYIKANRTLIESITTTKVSTTDIINDLITNVSDKPLSAAQGVVLKGLIDAISVPTKISQLINDAGFMTGFTETDPTVPSWAKASTKPTYTASEVGADVSGSAAAVQSQLNSHTANSVTHITAEERASWNAKSNFSGSYKDLTDLPSGVDTVDPYKIRTVELIAVPADMDTPVSYPYKSGGYASLFFKLPVPIQLNKYNYRFEILNFGSALAGCTQTAQDVFTVYFLTQANLNSSAYQWADFGIPQSIPTAGNELTFPHQVVTTMHSFGSTGFYYIDTDDSIGQCNADSDIDTVSYIGLKFNSRLGNSSYSGYTAQSLGLMFTYQAIGERN